jgi:hypothetical protein
MTQIRKLVVTPRYSETLEDDNQGRWARVVYAGNLEASMEEGTIGEYEYSRIHHWEVAWISKAKIRDGWDDKKFLVNFRFPNNSKSVYDSLEQALEEVTKAFNHFVKCVVEPEVPTYVKPNLEGMTMSSSKLLELPRPITVSGKKWNEYNEEVDTYKLNKFVDALYENKLPRLPLGNALYYHPADDWREAIISSGGNIKVSCDGNGYAFAFFPDGSAKLGTPHQMFDYWTGVKKNEGNFGDGFVTEPRWLAQGTWKVVGRGKQVTLTHICI